MEVSKQAEREALDRIREIINGIGWDSHVGAAFNGVFSVAVANIDYDEMTTVKELHRKAELLEYREKQLNDAQEALQAFKESLEKY